MAITMIRPAAIISGLALAGAAAALLMRDDGSASKAEGAVAEAIEVASGDSAGPAAASPQAPLADAPLPAAAPPAAEAPADLDFSLGSVDDLRKDQLSSAVAKIESVAGVAEQTKVWVATADVASAPGIETLYHLKGPLTCGRIGCDLLVVSGSKAVLLETIGEGVSSPAIDTLVVNQGTGSAVTWEFDGSRFRERR